MRGRSTIIATATALASFCVLSLSAQPHESSAPLPFGCEVRYFFRENVRGGGPGEKKVSAPSFEREPLPASRLLKTNGSSTRTVEGRVTHLPYQFVVKMKQTGPNEIATLEINVLSESGKSLEGFPQVMRNPIAKTGDATRKEFELPIGSALKKKIEKLLLAKDQFLTHVDLIIGADDDFLSANFPK